MNEKLIKTLQKTGISNTIKFSLKNGNKLQIKRLNNRLYRVRIEDNFRSDLTPVMLIHIDKNRGIKTFPFFYLKSILMYGVGGGIIIYCVNEFSVDNQLTGSDNLIIPFIPFLTIIGIQLIIMPIIYWVIKKEFLLKLR
ncbi:MAG: hypothetical protein JKY39_05395 [Pelagibacteraceae bacterium]|nr:hypothetical protein [Pelagibacteraceae bacterium]